MQFKTLLSIALIGVCIQANASLGLEGEEAPNRVQPESEAIVGDKGAAEVEEEASPPAEPAADPWGRVEPLKDFVPSENIPADQAADFPADI